ncbi:MAG: PspA/IM30 family protein [Armatimonadota bacterium]
MGTLGRLRRWLHQRGRLFRDPDAELARMCDDLEARLLEGHAEMAACESEERRLASLTSDAEWLASQMLAFARRALNQGQEALAREAVARHLHAQRQAGVYAQYWRNQQRDVARLREMLRIVEMYRDELEHRRSSLATRRRVAQTQHLLLKGLYGEETRAAVAMAEERALTEEYTAEAYGQLLSDPLVDELDALSAPVNQVEHTLARLRQEQQTRN